MKAVALDSRFGQLARQRELLSDGGLSPMERRVETRDLRQRRRVTRDRSDRRQVVRLMQRGQRHERVQLHQHAVVHSDWLGELRSAMHHAMPSRGESQFTESAALAPVEQKLDCAGMFQRRAGRPSMFVDDVPGRIASLESRFGQQRFQLTAQQQLRRIAVAKHRKLQAR